MTSFSLRSLRLRPGEEHREPKEIALEPISLGGQRYLPVPDKVQAELAVSRAQSGTVFELRYKTRLHGPCYRCLADAVVDIDVSAREYQATDPESDELRTPYVADDQLDLSAWARDAQDPVPHRLCGALPGVRSGPERPSAQPRRRGARLALGGAQRAERQALREGLVVPTAAAGPA